MATTPISSHQFVPLHLSGNTTDQQNQMLMAFLDEAVQQAYRTVIEQLEHSREGFDAGAVAALRSRDAGRSVIGSLADRYRAHVRLHWDRWRSGRPLLASTCRQGGRCLHRLRTDRGSS